MDVEDGPSIFHAHEGLGLDLTWERGGERRGKRIGLQEKKSQSVSHTVSTYSSGMPAMQKENNARFVIKNDRR